MAVPEELLRALRQALPPGIALVSVGGIDTPEIALARRAAGADLVQIHRGMVHQGYPLVAAINRSWRSNKKKPADFDRRVCGNSDSET
jgi:dihydroorotate dehydrogenase